MRALIFVFIIAAGQSTFGYEISGLWRGEFETYGTQYEIKTEFFQYGVSGTQSRLLVRSEFQGNDLLQSVNVYDSKVNFWWLDPKNIGSGATTPTGRVGGFSVEATFDPLNAVIQGEVFEIPCTVSGSIEMGGGTGPLVGKFSLRKSGNVRAENYEGVLTWPSIKDPSREQKRGCALAIYEDLRSQGVCLEDNRRLSLPGRLRLFHFSSSYC